MSEIARRAAQIQAENEARLERQKLIYAARDIARYVLPSLATAAAQHDGKRALDALQTCRDALQAIASGK